MNANILTKSPSTNRLNPIWNLCVGAGRANEALRSSWRDQLRTVHREAGFRYVRFHGLFHDDMFVYRSCPTGEVWNWQYVDDVFDALIDIGVRPFVELGFCPRDLARETGTVFWWKGNGSPPVSMDKWRKLVRNFLRHVIERYGRVEVRSWYFEVWNEPNLDAFWKGTRSEYFELYRHTAEEIKAVDAQLRVGGPSTSVFVMDDRFDGETWKKDRKTPADVPLENFQWKPVWVEAFLDFCHRENLPVDFISVHPYPTETGFEGDGTTPIDLSRHRDSLLHDMRTLGAILDRSPYAGAEIHCTEWSTSPLPRDHMHDALPAATYLIRANLQVHDLVHSLSYWVFTDIFEESGAGDSIFHGGFGLLNFQGIPKPAFHAYRFLNRLGPHILDQREQGILTRHENGDLAMLLWNYPEEVTQAPAVVATRKGREPCKAFAAMGQPRKITVHLSGLSPGARFEIQHLNHQSGNAVAIWESMGAPEEPTREQTAALKDAAMTLRIEVLQADATGVLACDRVLPPWGIELWTSRAE